MSARTKAAPAALVVVVCASLWLWLPLSSRGAPVQDRGSLQQKIESTRAKIGVRKGTERVLTSDIARYSTRIRRLEGDIDALRVRERRVRADLDVRRAELSDAQARLRLERARLSRLRSRLATGRERLARRLVELYQADRPDLVTVVLNAKGFADLLERGEFLSRIQAQDERIVAEVRAAKREATSATERLTTREHRLRRLTRLVLERRDEIAEVKQRVIDTQVGYRSTQAAKRRVLGKVRSQRVHLAAHLQELLRESARVTTRLRAGVRAPDLPGGSIRRGSGQLIWPINGTLTSPFCETRAWESCHPGIDIAAPAETPIRTTDGGRVMIAGWTGGYGNYTCVQHSPSMASCYAHQSQINVSVGQQVSQGQVIGLVGSTGRSTGPHLHFEIRIGGAVVSPLAYL